MKSIRKKESSFASSRAFWDIDLKEMDDEKHAMFIIVRILERGDHADLITMINYYGKERILEELHKAPHLREDVVNFINVIFESDLKPSNASQERYSS